MILGQVVGPVIATARHPALQADTLLLVQPIDEQGVSAGAPLVAIDHAQAGEGDRVLVLKEGNGARQVLKRPNAPVQAVIVAIVDDVSVDGPTSEVG